ncbi:MAG: hypothetical protein AB8U25_06555 [Rickettsiales endosymbiont of Dermacentor nuttalli]
MSTSSLMLFATACPIVFANPLRRLGSEERKLFKVVNEMLF